MYGKVWVIDPHSEPFYELDMIRQCQRVYAHLKARERERTGMGSDGITKEGKEELER